MSDEELVEVLRCAADLCTEELCPDVEIEQWMCAISHAKEGIFQHPSYIFGDDVKARTGIDVVFSDGCEDKRDKLLEAAMRIEEGWVPE